MATDPVPQIILAIIALIFSGIFTLIKFSYENINKYKLEDLEDSGEISSKERKAVQALLEDIDEILEVLLILDYISNIALSLTLGFLGYNMYGNIGIIFSLLLSTLLILTIGENVPYYISTIKASKIAVSFRSFTLIISKIFYPLYFLTNGLSIIIARLIGGEKEFFEPKITEDELKTAVNLSKDEGLLDLDEFALIEKVFEFRDSFVKDVMTPRTDVVALNVNTSLDEIMDVFIEEGFSRLPVYGDDIDSILGTLHVKDLLPFLKEKNELRLEDILRKPLYTFEYQKTADLFTQMRQNKIFFAIVLDEYGGTDGICTMEDLIEELVGEIEDEYDDDFQMEIIPLKENTYILDGMLRLEDLEDSLGISLESEEVETVGGFVLEHFDKIPEKEEVLKYKNMKFTVLDLERNRISRLKLEVEGLY